MLVPPQLAAFMPSQQTDDVVLDSGAGQGRRCEMAEIKK